MKVQAGRQVRVGVRLKHMAASGLLRTLAAGRGNLVQVWARTGVRGGAWGCGLGWECRSDGLLRAFAARRGNLVQMRAGVRPGRSVGVRYGGVRR